MQTHFIEDWTREQQSYEEEASPLRRALSVDLKNEAGNDLEGLTLHLEVWVAEGFTPVEPHSAVF